MAIPLSFLSMQGIATGLTALAMTFLDSFSLHFVYLLLSRMMVQ